MRQEFLDLMEDSRRAHEAFYIQFKRLEEMKPDADLKELADAAFACKRSEESLDDVRKKMSALRAKYENLAGLLWTTQSLMADDDRIQTEYVTATVKVSKEAAIPRKKQEPEAFVALMRYLEVPERLWNMDDPEASEAVHIHWPGFSALITKLESEGKPLPPGIDPKKTFKKFTLSMRAKRRSVGGETDA